jgi:hypothetical protein
MIVSLPVPLYVANLHAIRHGRSPCGRLSALRGRLSALRGRLSALRGRLSALRGRLFAFSLFCHWQSPELTLILRPYVILFSISGASEIYLFYPRQGNKKNPSMAPMLPQRLRGTVFSCKNGPKILKFKPPIPSVKMTLLGLSVPLHVANPHAIRDFSSPRVGLG